MPILTVRHVTTYRYANPVSFSPHRMMFRPRDSHDLRLLDSAVIISPPPARLRWLHDVFGNSIAVAEFETDATELRFESDITIETFGLAGPDYPIEEFARAFPFSYPAEEMADLARTNERHYADPEHKVDAWARQFLQPPFQKEGEPPQTWALLEGMTRHIKETFTYQARDLMGTQTPLETLDLNSGTCRDFALLMMEAARSLGLAARFVSGYLYDPAADGGPDGTLGGGATHAWVQVYLPGAGWVEFDPTNALIGTHSLIRVAVAREPWQAVPLSGEWFGAPADFLGMTVDVTVTSGRQQAADAEAPPPAES